MECIKELEKIKDKKLRIDKIELVSYIILSILLFCSCFSEIFSWLVLILILVLSIFFSQNNLLKLIVFLATFKLCLLTKVGSHIVNFKNIALFIIIFSMCIRFLIDFFRKKQKLTLKVFIPALAFMVYIGLSSFRGFNFIVILDYIMMVFALYFLYEIREQIKLDEVIIFLCIGVIISTTFSFCKPISPRLNEMMGDFRQYGITKLSGLLSNPNIWVLYGGISICGLLYLKVNKKISDLMFYSLFIPLLIFGNYTISRNFIFTFAVEVILFYLFSFIKHKRKALKPLGIFTLSIIMIGVIFINPTKANLVRLNILPESIYNVETNIEDVEDKEPAVDSEKPETETSEITKEDFKYLVFNGLIEYDPGRFEIWKLYLERIFGESIYVLLGVGLDSPNIGQRVAHNFFLQTMYHIGIVGLMLLMLLILSLINWKKIKSLYLQYTKTIFILPCFLMMIVESCLGNLSIFILLSLILSDEKFYKSVFKEKICYKKENEKNLKKDEGNKLNNKKLISVVIPIYKVEKYLDRGIESILNQTYKNLEIILVDDGSPDNCPKMCDEWAKKDNRIKVIHKENGGVSSARNAGLEIASGDFITFFDPDDLVDETMYEKLLKLAVEEKSDVAMCRFLYLYEDTGKKLPVFEENLQKINEFGVYEFLLKNDKEKTENYIKTNNVMGSVCRGIYSKNIIKDMRFERVIIAEDFIFLVDLFSKDPKISIVDEYLYNYVQRKTSALHQTNEKKIYDHLKSQVMVCERLQGLVSDAELNANKFHFCSKIILELIKNKQKTLLVKILNNEHIKNFNSKENYLCAKKLTRSKKLKVAYFIVYHKCFWVYSLISKIF